MRANNAFDPEALRAPPIKKPALSGLFQDRENGYSRLAPPQLVLPLVAFQIPAAVVALVQAGVVAEPSVGAAAPLP